MKTTWLNPISKPICIASLGLLVLVVTVVSLFGSALPHVDHGALVVIRTLVAAFAILYAIYCARQLYGNLAISGGIAQEFRPALVFISIFWVMVPPVWFFTEYFVLDSGIVSGLKDGELTLVKTYADYASKIWAGVVTV